MYIIIFIIKLINLIIIFIDAMIKISLRLFSTNPKICITSKWKPLAQESWQRPCYSIKYKVFMFFSRNGNFQPLCLKKKKKEECLEIGQIIEKLTFFSQMTECHIISKFIFFGFHHRLLIWGSILTSSGFSHLPITVAGIESWSSLSNVISKLI
jgi:hypothetical protein